MAAPDSAVRAAGTGAGSEPEAHAWRRLVAALPALMDDISSSSTSARSTLASAVARRRNSSGTCLDMPVAAVEHLEKMARFLRERPGWGCRADVHDIAVDTWNMLVRAANKASGGGGGAGAASEAFVRHQARGMFAGRRGKGGWAVGLCMHAVHACVRAQRERHASSSMRFLCRAAGVLPTDVPQRAWAHRRAAASAAVDGEHGQRVVVAPEHRRRRPHGRSRRAALLGRAGPRCHHQVRLRLAGTGICF